MYRSTWPHVSNLLAPMFDNIQHPTEKQVKKLDWRGFYKFDIYARVHSLEDGWHGFDGLPHCTIGVRMPGSTRERDTVLTVISDAKIHATKVERTATEG